VSSFVFCGEIAASTGASFMGLTVRTKDFVSVSVPSVTTTEMVVDPLWLRAGVIERLQFDAMPELVRFTSGTSVLFDEVKETEPVQVSEESISVNE
jgi:hypothetical protein